ncbi:diaminopimelate epimerase [Arenibaculum pallidiluteum]|uniref:diaminopimelate epimerase n=1 Tax=Arenibaculum pallidiluteum TaxID=2812559 RepID=UPI001A974987|nr:diaminopimelate epimerase [Arenibaculum pallidiluteum]
MSLPFLKMHGLGNDFVVLDARRSALVLSPAQVRAVADRRTGVGCDQLIVLEPGATPGADVFMRIYNPDGSEAGACGNATRCVASLVSEEESGGPVGIQTIAGLLKARPTGGGGYEVDMGPARLDWREIPLAGPADTLRLDVEAGPLSAPCAVNMGNPHAVFFVEDADAVDLAAWGPRIEHHPAFPDRTNVEIVQVLGPELIRMRVWERGAGITRACGSGACAALVAAARRGLTGRRATVRLDGGDLEITWREDGHVLMAGPTALAFRGTLAAELLAV